MRGLHMADGQQLDCDHVVLAVGYSSRDTFEMLFNQGVHVEAKPFSIGVRIEHPQSVIDLARFGKMPATRCLVLRTTVWYAIAAMGVRLTVFAQFPAERWLPPRPNPVALSPMG